MTTNHRAEQQHVYNLRANQELTAGPEKFSPNSEQKDSRISRRKKSWDLENTCRLPPCFYCFSTLRSPLMCSLLEFWDWDSTKHNSMTPPCWLSSCWVLLMGNGGDSKGRKREKGLSQSTASLPWQKTAPAPAASFLQEDPSEAPARTA